MKAIKIKAKTAQSASEIYCDMREKSGEGSSTFPCGEWRGNHISYNGKVWSDKNDWAVGIEPIFNPYGARAAGHSMTPRQSCSAEYMRQYRRLDNKIVAAGVTLGKSGRQMIIGLPDEIQNWLIGQVPEGATISDVVAAIVTDAFHDDAGARK